MRRVNDERRSVVTLTLLATAVVLLALLVPFSAGATTSAYTVYDDALASGWDNWSWGTSADFNHNGSVHAGNAALAVTHASGWAGLYLHSNTLIDTGGYDTLRFWIHGGGTNHDVQVALADANDTLLAAVPVSVAADSWQQVELPLATWGGLSNVSGIVWQDASGSAQPTYYLDDVTFVDSSSQATATATMVPTATATPPSGDNTTADVTLSVDVASGQGAISPHIYGINFEDEQYARELNIPLRRWGGNATTRYNWQLDVSNRASDWYFENIPNDTGNPALLPDGSGSDLFVEANRRTGADSILTVPLIGWTPKSREITCGFSVGKYGAQQQTDSWRADCGNGVRLDGSLITGNDPADTSVPIDPTFVQDWLRHLTGKYGRAAEGGVRFYNLDNEPMLWHETHRDVHPGGVGYDEIWERTLQYAPAIKAIDPSAQILGPTVWGWTAYFYSGIDAVSGNWNSPPDRNAHGGTPFVEWYLQQMQAYEQQHGQRILDYLDLHYYPQAPGVSLAPAGDANTKALRLRSTRALWDPGYVDESWINEPVQLIPRMRQWVDANYPGTKLALTEYNFGGHEDINGALAQADVLGIFGREGLDLATLWAAPAPTDPAAYAFRIYRNYDGVNSTFGDVRLAASSSDQGQLAVYAARRSADGATTVVVINKSGGGLAGAVNVQGLTAGTVAEVYRYSEANLAAIVREADQVVGSNGFDATFPANSITLFVIPGNGTSQPSPTPTASATTEPTATPTAEPTLEPTATAQPTVTPLPTEPAPTATPTDEPTSSSLHVADLDGYSNSERNTWEARATILVADGNNQPVANATVSGQWSAGPDSVSCTTSASGWCLVYSPTLAKNEGMVTFTVSGVDHSSLAYDSSANGDADGDSDGTAIDIRK